MTTSTGDAPMDWERLGDALFRRRITWQPRYRNRGTFCEDRGIDYRLVLDIELHKRTNFGRATMLDIARAFAVTPESINATLAGGELELLPEPATGDAPGMLPMTVPAPRPHADDDDVEAMVRAEVERHPPGTPGTVIFTDPDEARNWDALAGAGVPVAELVPMIAWWRRRNRPAGGNPGHTGADHWSARRPA